MKTFLWILGGVIVLALAAGAGFEGGITYQKNQTNQIRAQFFQARGLNGSATGSTGTRGAGFGGGVAGQIQSVQGNTIQLTTGTNVTTVDLTANTQIEKSTAGTTADLKPGEQLVVRGQRDSSGTLTATQIQIVSSGAAQAAPAQ